MRHCIISKDPLFMNYNNKKFKVIEVSENGEVSETLIFDYKQVGNILSATYNDTNIIKGHLLGWVDTEGNITMSYHQINKEGVINTGKCTSKPEILSNGRIRLHETWQWTSGTRSKGQSILEEV